MTTFEKDIAYIDKYLRSELNEEEQKQFEERLKSDAEFNKQFREMLAIRDATRRTVLEEKLSVLEGFESAFKQGKLKPSAKVRKINKYYWISGIAASLILLAILIPQFWSGKSDNMDLAMDYFEPYPANVIKRGESDLSKTKEQAYAYYGIGNYKKAAPLLAQLCYKGDTLSCFYAGIAYLGVENPEKALKFLEMERLPVEDDVMYWYRGLGYWGSGQEEKAKDAWRRLKNDSKYNKKNLFNSK